MKYLMWIVILVTLTGCSFKEHNELIARSNTDRFVAFSEGINAAPTDGARIAIAMAFAANLGAQRYERPETVKDYANAFMPYVSFLAPFVWGNAGDDTQSVEVGGDYYVGSFRNDATSVHDSAVQNYTIKDSINTSVASNDQELPETVTTTDDHANNLVDTNE